MHESIIEHLFQIVRLQKISVVSKINKKIQLQMTHKLQQATQLHSTQTDEQQLKHKQ